MAEVKFEEVLTELEGIVRELEGGDLTLDESLAKYEKGIVAYKRCHELLSKAEKKIETLMRSDDGALAPQPLEAEATFQGTQA